MYFAWRIGASGMNAKCGAAMKVSQMRKRDVQALYLSPGFSDFGGLA